MGVGTVDDTLCECFLVILSSTVEPLLSSPLLNGHPLLGGQ